MNNKNYTLEESFEYCRKLTYSNAKNFYFSFLFLPKHLRSAIYTVYAFCRIADDIADDENNDAETKKKQFIEFDKLFELCYSENKVNHEMFTSLQYIIKEYRLSKEYLYDIVIGVRTDLYKTHYDGFNELYDYCFKVASRVAYVCIELFVPENERTQDLFKYAENLGLALQLTNILRDVKEDKNKNRRYIPAEWLAQFGLTNEKYEKFINDGKITELKELFVFIDKTAENYYFECDKYITCTQKKYLFTLEIIKSIYFELLKKIGNDYSSLLTGRVSLSFWFKLWTALKIRLQN
ncbi:phytoene/squalene synthase family protein [Candidatus Dependentiae bacterium]|nr:phytoene/squalene synthase family protein [Candidatus Dependentiae bacterium]